MKSAIDGLAAASEAATRLERALGTVLIGQETVVREVLTALFAGGHVLVEGVPGLGKTLLGRALARSVQGQFGRIQFTPDLMPSDVTGHTLYDARAEQFVTRRGPVFCNFLLADEINRAPAKTQAALLEVMQEQQVTIDGSSVALDPPFMVLATQNPIEQEGTYPLPESQVDRFLLKVRIGYPGAADETALVRRIAQTQVGEKLNVDSIEPILEPEDVLRVQSLVAGIGIDDQVMEYGVRLARATREWRGIQMGAGPRGSIALIRAARAYALLAGNSFVTPDDIKAVAPAVLRHRIALTPDLEIEGMSADDVLARLLLEVQAPRA
ncbi:MAG: MoxR family ATPase [Gammaproteobacteria bacterium]|nr:MoxR family ATPase [Gammaproteobacteria bacterium]